MCDANKSKADRPGGSATCLLRSFAERRLGRPVPRAIRPRCSSQRIRGDSVTMRFIMANSPNTFRPLARCAQGRCEPVAAPPAIWRSLAKPAWSMPCQGPGDSVPCRSWGLSESRGSRNARRAEDRRESRGASGTCVSFPSHHLPERMNGERLPRSRSPPRGRKPEVPTNSNHHLNKPRLQAVRPKAALRSLPSFRRLARIGGVLIEVGSGAVETCD